MIRADAILALLEPSGTTQSTTDLASHFDVSVAVMTASMAPLVDRRLVSRNNRSGRWMRVLVTAPPVADLEAVCEQLRFGPKAISQMVTALGSSFGAIERALEQLRDARRVKTIGRASGARWVTFDWTPAIGRRTELPRVSAPPAARKALSEMMERGSTNEFTAVSPKRAPTPVGTDGLSWWVPFAGAGMPREAFAAAARKRNEAGVADAAWRRGTKVTTVGLGSTDV